jgi:hypothetical protein
MTNTPDQFKYLIIWGRQFQNMDNYLFMFTEEEAFKHYKALRVREEIESPSPYTAPVQLFKRVGADLDPTLEAEIEEAIFNRKAELQRELERAELQKELGQKDKELQRLEKKSD